MKYLVIVIISVFTGFVGAWLLFDATVPDMPLPSATRTNPANVPAAPVIIYRTATEDITFEQIEHEPSVFNQQFMAWHLAAQSDIAELEKLIDKCLDKDDPLFSNNVTSILMEKYVALDPRAAFDFVKREPRFDQAEMLAHVLTSWVRYDPDAALGAFELITDRRAKFVIGSRLLADTTLWNLNLTPRIEEALGPYAEQIVRRVEMQQGDPAELFETALRETGQRRQSALSVALRRWIARDPEAALRRIQGMSNQPDRAFAMQFALQSYAQQDPGAALTWLRSNDPQNAQLESQILNSFAQRDIEQALPLFEDFYRRTGDRQAIQNLVSVWSHTDPVRALAYADRYNADEKRTLYQAVASGYLEKYPEQGLNWVLSLGPEYRNVKLSAVSNLAFNNQDLAERALGQIDDVEIRSSLIQGIVGQRARYDPEGAMDWLSSYANEPGYVSALSSVAWQLANRDPVQAARLIEPVLDSDGQNQMLIHPLFQSWYRRDPRAAINWVKGLEAGVRTQAISIAANFVARSDIDEARDMLDSLPEGDTASNTRMQIATAWAMREPDRIDEIISELELSDEMAAILRNQLTSNGIFR